MNSVLSTTHSSLEHGAALTVDEWLRLRSVVNHDWLKNGFVPALSAVRNTVLGLIRNPQFGRGSWMGLISDWNTHLSLLTLLVKSAEHALSPARLFEEGSLQRAQFSSSFNEWASGFIHQLWIKRVGLDGQLARATMTLECARLGAVALERAIGTDAELEAVSSFLESVRELSAALSALPQRMEVL